ncbi:UdgX family uracil-DNA binding protein [Brevundimonas faecalis]|uniref:Type-4 uracil-DNA glycosylase n=1 Tax=Brevundimonas faecalis TaxID=947378 RepID=A0ABV2R7X0_9CAUL
MGEQLARSSSRSLERTRKPVGELALEAESPVPPTLLALERDVQECRRCPLWRGATQGVGGEGPSHAALMVVGEQPGDQEDLSGRPFVGPAGRLLDAALREAGLDRRDLYLTNAVKHFKHEMRGKRRLHKTPNTGEVRACRWWLDHERRLIKPRLILALGATAGSTLLGRTPVVKIERGRVQTALDGSRIVLTVHPSYLLRLRDRSARASERRRFLADLETAAANQ